MRPFIFPDPLKREFLARYALNQKNGHKVASAQTPSRRFSYVLLSRSKQYFVLTFIFFFFFHSPRCGQTVFAVTTYSSHTHTNIIANHNNKQTKLEGMNLQRQAFETDTAESTRRQRKRFFCQFTAVTLPRNDRRRNQN